MVALSPLEQEQLIESVYAAAGDPHLWTEVVNRLAQHLDATMAATIQHDLGHSNYNFEASIGNPEEARRLCEQYCGALDPWASANIAKTRQGWGGSEEELIPQEQFSPTEFHNDFLRYFPMFHQAGAFLQMQGVSVAALTELRDRAQAFDNSEIALLEQVLPHLRRGLHLHRRMLELQQTNTALSSAFDAVPFGVVLLDSFGRILATNKAAQEICAGPNGLRVTRDTIRATSAKDDRALRRILAAAKALTPGNHGGGAIQIARESGTSLVVVASAVRGPHQWPLGTCVSVFITDPDRHAVTAGEILQKAFGLTPAEARLASVLASGESVSRASERMAVTENTIRTQLKSIFSKTQTDRQSQLIALISKLPG